MKSKRRKKITTKKHNLITSTQSNVPNNTKINQPKVVMQEIFLKKKILQKMKNKILRKRKRERNNLLLVGKLCIELEREL